MLDAMKIEHLWKMPVPASALYCGPAFSVLPGRECQISLEYEGEDGEPGRSLLKFSGCVAFLCTFMHALSVDQLEAYGRVVSLGESEWLAEIAARVSRSGQESAGLRHLMICFDDGPCYEFICRGFTSH